MRFRFLLIWLSLCAGVLCPAFGQVSTYPNNGGSSVCTVSGTKTTGYVLTSTDGSTGCSWQAAGSATVDANALKNAWYLTDSGTANAVTGSTTTAYPGAYAAGQCVVFTANATNTGAATINVATLGNKSLAKSGGTALAAGNKVSGTDYLACYDGTQFQLLNFTLLAADIPTLNQNTTGTAGNVTGIVAEANGGTGANNTTGTAGHVLRSNGTHYVDSAIQAADVPTLNQDTTGSAAKVNGAQPPASAPVAATNSSRQIVAATTSGNGTIAVTTTGSQTSTAIVFIDSAGNHIASGWTIDSSGNLSGPGNISAGVGSGKSTATAYTGATSGSVWIAARDAAGTAITYYLPSTNGSAGQFLMDNGSITCDTNLPSTAPSTCHQLIWASAAKIVASGSSTMGTAAISNNSCATTITTSAPGTTTSGAGSHITWTPSTDMSLATGYSYTSTDGLKVYVWPTADNVNFHVCNGTGSPITPGAAIVFNWVVF